MSKLDEYKEELIKKKLLDQIDAHPIDKLNFQQKVDQIIMVSSGVAAGAAVQPLPFADFPILTTIEIIMVMKIGQIYGFELNMDRAGEVFKELASVIGMGYLAQQGILIGYKTVIPFAGGFFTIPLVFGSCYGIGKAADYYFKCKVNDVPFLAKIAKEIFNQEKRNGEKIHKKKDE